VIYNELGDVPAAIKELESSLKKHPDYLIAQENIADLYIKMALSYYKKSIEKTDDKALQSRYARLLQVRDPAQLGGPSVSISMVVKDAPVRPSLNRASVNATSRMQRPAMPTVDSTSIDNYSSTQSEDSSMLVTVNAVKSAVEAWRQAWQTQNLPNYFSAYADDYIVPSKFKNESSWEAYKARVIGNKKFITVMLTDMAVTLRDDQMHAQVSFDQAFRSNSYNGDDNKRLTLKKYNGAWKIVSEETL